MQTLRRIITGNNPQGRSYVVADEPVEHGVLWRCNGPFPLGADAGLAALLPTTAPHIEPAAGGNFAFFGSFPPWSSGQSQFAGGALPGFDEEGFHRTGTIDYLFILTGEVELLLDESRVLVKAGDLVIQRNTRHAWQNRTEQTATYLAVTIRTAGS